MASEILSMDARVVQQVAERLASLPSGVRAPTSYGDAPSKDQLVGYLSDLINRDAGLFLERYHDKLSDEEAAFFEPLRQASYEVDFYLRLRDAEKPSTSGSPVVTSPNGQPPAQPNPSRPSPPRLDPERPTRKPSARAKNRRLAFLRRLEARGDFFSDEAMKRREPLLFQQYIGRFEPRGGEAVGGGGTYVEGLLEKSREAEWQVQWREARDRERKVYPEEEDESDDSGDDEEGTSSGDEGGRVRGEGAARGNTTSVSEGVGADRAFLREEFEDLMRMRFLAGKDYGFDYDDIDHDAELDDDFLVERARDEEDAYFLAEEDGPMEEGQCHDTGIQDY